jgi:hypothetical protein
MSRRIIFLLALALGLAACDSTGPRDGTRLSIFLTDGPGDVESAWIQIDRILMLGDDNGEIEVPADLDEMIEITELVDRVHALATEVPFEPDSFRELRLVLAGAVLQTKQGEVYATAGAELPAELQNTQGVLALQCPSCAQSGLKIKVQGASPELEEGESASLVLDFDVAQSFGHQAGRSGRWIMHPVIHATWVEAPEPETSAISGTVAIQQNAGVPAFAVPQCPAGTARSVADFIPKATAATLRDASNNPIVRTGSVAANGTFSISPVDADSYAMGFNETLLGAFKLVWTATVAPASVTVVANGPDVTGVAYTLTGASCLPNP